MTRDEMINEFTSKLKKFERIAFNIAGEDDAPDLFQMCLLMLLEKNEAQLQAAYNPNEGLKPYFISMLKLQYTSGTSYFHRDYRKQEIQLREKRNDILLNAPQSEDLTADNPAYFEAIEAACKTIYDNAPSPLVADLQKKVWELYIEHGSLRKTLAALPQVYTDLLDLKSVHVIVQKFQRTIKEYLENNYEY